jgi:arginyl-tRNA synthetase
MVDLPSGKKSREGTVVDADDLMQEMIILLKNCRRFRKLDSYSAEEKTKLYSTIGLGALKYYSRPKKNPFNPEESVDFAGIQGRLFNIPMLEFNQLFVKQILIFLRNQE